MKFLLRSRSASPLNEKGILRWSNVASLGTRTREPSPKNDSFTQKWPPPPCSPALDASMLTSILERAPSLSLLPWPTPSSLPSRAYLYTVEHALLHLFRPCSRSGQVAFATIGGRSKTRIPESMQIALRSSGIGLQSIPRHWGKWSGSMLVLA